jgi:hypothetical protein
LVVVVVDAVEMALLKIHMDPERTVDLEVVDIYKVKEPLGKGLQVVYWAEVVVPEELLPTALAMEAMEALGVNLPSRELPFIMRVVVQDLMEMVGQEEEAATTKVL